VYSGPNQENYSNIHIEATVVDNSSDSTTAFGVMCHQQVVNDSFYYAGITSNGSYGIVKAAIAKDDEIITSGDSDLIAKNAGTYRLGVDCGNGTITLYVDGKQIASASDSTYTSGGVALFAWSGEQANGSSVTFDDFVVTSLP
jgi:hypothetical protein